MRLVLELSDLGNLHLKSRERRSGASVFSLAEGEGMATGLLFSFSKWLVPYTTLR